MSVLVWWVSFKKMPSYFPFSSKSTIFLNTQYFEITDAISGSILGVRSTDNV